MPGACLTVRWYPSTRYDCTAAKVPISGQQWPGDPEPFFPAAHRLLMFILYALVIGIGVGLLAGGQMSGIGEIRFRLAGLAGVGLLIQVVLFAGPVADRIGNLGVPLYVGSTVMVLAALLRNVAVPGIWIVALGALSNMAAIAANGGYMPAAPGALASLGLRDGPAYSNSAVVAHPALQPLTDIFALPAGLPFANVFSIGDVLIGVGIAVVLAMAMFRAKPQPQVRS